MRNFFVGCVCGLIVGVIGATALFTFAQSPQWYETPQGQWQRQRDILEPWMQEDLRQRPLPYYPTPWERPC
jgi:hypothetical protein